MIPKNVEWDQPPMTKCGFPPTVNTLGFLPQTSYKWGFYGKHSNLRL